MSTLIILRNHLFLSVAFAMFGAASFVVAMVFAANAVWFFFFLFIAFTAGFGYLSDRSHTRALAIIQGKFPE